jgi:3-phosphoshikimate 1-carboxyvinyltransferase
MDTKINGIISAPPSKSMAQRAIAAALLAEGTSNIYLGAHSEDIEASIRIIKALGATVIEKLNGCLAITGGLSPISEEIDCGEAGLSMRMFSSIAALSSKKLKLVGRGSLKTRPMKTVEDFLSGLGAKVSLNGELPPITIQGPIKSGKITLDGSLSSQYLTGLLLALPTLPGETELTVLNLKSKPYIEMTLELISDFGVKIEHDSNFFNFFIPGNQKYRSREYTVEGDWSGAAFLAVAAAIAGDVTIENLRIDSKQADRKIVDAILQFGALLTSKENSLQVKRAGANPILFDATECPDLFPPLVALAASANGVSRIRGVHRLKHKESDRENALKTEFRKLGIEILTEDDCLVVTGGPISGVKVFSHHDHRIAMALAVAGLNAATTVEIEHPECVAKSYPDFYKDLNSLKA